ncbi:hypothetical protein Csa_006731 [Cucumis sativus]|nr:hypothetical protein Csa_006731 [Cucumis sativus]
MTYLHRMGVSSLSFCMPTMPTNQSSITLKYRIPCQENPFYTKVLPMSIVEEPAEVGDVDYGSFFVSMALEEFRCVVQDMENADYVRVTITSSQIKFVAPVDHWETSFTTQEGKCIIGGIEEGEEIKCGISLYPMEFYKAFTSKRVWFFSSCDTNGLLLIAPMGVYTHISSFFPQDIPNGGNTST